MNIFIVIFDLNNVGFLLFFESAQFHILTSLLALLINFEVYELLTFG